MVDHRSINSSISRPPQPTISTGVSVTTRTLHRPLDVAPRVAAQRAVGVGFESVIGSGLYLTKT